MIQKIAILNKFCRDFDHNHVKIETTRFGFDVLDFVSTKAHIDYVEFKQGIHKYKLSKVSPHLFDDLLESHLNQNLNLCVYFHKRTSNKLALNFDQTKKHTVDAKIAAKLTNNLLSLLSMPPLVIASGRGYHLWCNFNSSLSNDKLISLSQLIRSLITYEITIRGGNPENVNLTCYPADTPYKNSLRLFGSKHVRTGKFSHIISEISIQDVLLNQANSWLYFNNFMNNNWIDLNTFERAILQIEMYMQEKNISKSID